MAGKRPPATQVRKRSLQCFGTMAAISRSEATLRWMVACGPYHRWCRASMRGRDYTLLETRPCLVGACRRPKHRRTARSMPSTPLRLLVAAGGTGGHVLPAVAVIEELTSRDIQLEILWIGSRKGVERDIAHSHEIPFSAIQTGKLRRYFSLETVTDMLRLPVGLVQAFLKARAFKPDVIFSTGGNVSVPTVVAGSRL